MNNNTSTTTTDTSRTRKVQSKPFTLQGSSPEMASYAPLPSESLQRAAMGSDPIQPTDMVQLQRTVGNQVVQRMLDTQRQIAKDRSAPPPMLIRRKLKVGPAHDKFEEEADQISGQVVQRTPESSSPSTEVRSSAVGPQGGALDSRTTGAIKSARSGGQALSASLRAPMEQKLGTDFSKTRLHVGGKADQLNDKLGARAFTSGPDIFLKREEYNPHSADGRKLLYHEMTHVAQQSGVGQVQRAPNKEVIQREVTKKQGAISGMFDMLVTNQGNRRTVDDHLNQFSMRQGTKEGRKQQKQDKKNLKKLLHFDKSQTKDTVRIIRLVIRSVLTYESAFGTDPAVLAELRRFLTEDHEQIFPLVNENYELGVVKGYMNGDEADVKRMIELATAWGASPALLNVFYSHMDFLWEKFDEVIPPLVEAARRIYQRAEDVSHGSTETPLIRLRFLARRMNTEATNAENFHQQRSYSQAKASYEELKRLHPVVVSMTQYGESSKKSSHTDQSKTGVSKRLGGGEMNKVFEMNYDTNRNPKPNNNMKITHGVFKQEPVTYNPQDAYGAKASGIPEFEPNFSGRSIATYKVDKLLGLGLTPVTKSGVHDNVSGSVQDWAKGEEPQKMIGGQETRYREFDYDDPEIQRQLATLQILDAITGQVDRHASNYYIYQGPEGTRIIAIDNDISFGKDKDVEQMVDDIWHRPLGDDMSRGLPLFVDEVVAEQILRTTPKQLKDTISSQHLSQAEISKTLQRFAKVKEHLRKLKSNTKRIIAMQNRLESLYARRAKLDDNSHGAEAMDTQIEFCQRELGRLNAQGALLDKSEWGKETAQYFTTNNSYYGMLITQVQKHRAQNKMIPLTPEKHGRQPNNQNNQDQI